ncbi:hypothetical protein ElyMa_004473900 [Elysia marginata]|uniref:Uncharacterized protein n=1 Tax=Elysia marginata TaxID=1093978 RepID=A0AAV4HH54_9GAST|nr:hypothetical protein ElyMa_004473900 [Elysia marginata]
MVLKEDHKGSQFNFKYPQHTELTLSKMATETIKAPSLEPEIRDQMLATLYGQAVGDAIGLLAEFMTKEEAIEVII